MCGYQPGGLLPYNHLIWADSKERLVEVEMVVTGDEMSNDDSHDDDDNGIVYKGDIFFSGKSPAAHSLS